MLIIPLGDPYSINIAAISKLLPRTPSNPTILIGSHKQWLHQIPADQLWLREIPVHDRLGHFSQPTYYFLNIDVTHSPLIPPEHLDLVSRGRISVQSLQPIHEIKSNRLAVLTCPINKAACQAAGFKFPGQTEFFEYIWEKNGIMIMHSQTLSIGLVTNHIPLVDVTSKVNPSLIIEKARNFRRTLKKIRKINQPNIAICGLNPHAGEDGLCGNHEKEIIEPAIHKLGKGFHGPISADTAFYRSIHGEFDGVLAMYHAQGLAPIKTLFFDQTINITGGLKHFRCSPDHGPAADKYLSKRFSLKSFSLAFQACNDYLSEIDK